MIQFPAGFDIAQVVIDLVTIVSPLFQLVLIVFAASLIIAALVKGRESVK